MSKTVSFRCSSALDEFLEREAERQMTTKSSVAQRIVADYAQDMMGDELTEHPPGDVPESDRDALKGTPIKDGWAVFPTKAKADAFRRENRDLVDDGRDDKRQKRVFLHRGVPVEVLPDGATVEGPGNG